MTIRTQETAPVRPLPLMARLAGLAGPDRRSPRRLAALLGTVGGLVSLLGSWIPSLWGDEAASVMSAERSLPSLLSMLTHVDAVHGTYYLGLHVWISVFGASPLSVRLPSAIATGLTVAAVVVLADRLSTRAVAVTAGIICIVLPRVTFMGEEARSYALSAAVVSWLTVLFLELLAGRARPRMWTVYGIALAFGTYLFLFSALILLVHAIVLLRSRPAHRLVSAWIRASAYALCATIPLVALAYAERSQIAYLTRTPQVTPVIVFETLWFGSPGTDWLDDAGLAFLGWGLIVAAVVFALRRLRNRPPQTSPGPQPVPLAPDGARPPSLHVLGLTWLVVPSTILIASQGWYPDFTARYLSFCAPGVALSMAAGLAFVARRRVAILTAGLVAIVVAAAPSYFSERGPYGMEGSDWAELSATVGAHAHPGDAIVFDQSVRPSRRPQLALHTYPAGFRGLRDVTLKTPFDRNDTWYDSVYSVSQAYDLGRFDSVTRVWVVEHRSGSHVDQYGIDDLEDHGFRESGAHYRTLDEEVYLFER